MNVFAHKLLDFLRNQSAMGFKEIAHGMGVSVEDVREAVIHLRDMGLVKAVRRYDGSWRVSSSENTPAAPAVERPSGDPGDSGDFVDPNTLSTGDLFRLLAELQDQMAAVQEVLRNRGAL